MLSNLKMKVAKQRLASAIKNNRTGADKKFPRFGVILDSDDDSLKEKFLKLKEEFNLRDTDLVILTCREEMKKGDEYQGLIFSRKDLNWKGTVKNGEVLNFAKGPMDVLVSFTEKDSKLAAFLVSVSNADLKVGRCDYENASGLFDIVIDTDFDEVEVFMMELKKYLRIIKQYA